VGGWANADKQNIFCKVRITSCDPVLTEAFVLTHHSISALAVPAVVVTCCLSLHLPRDVVKDPFRPMIHLGGYKF
jgi:hypothetical protein